MQEGRGVHAAVVYNLRLSLFFRNASLTVELPNWYFYNWHNLIFGTNLS